MLIIGCLSMLNHCKANYIIKRDLEQMMDIIFIFLLDSDMTSCIVITSLIVVLVVLVLPTGEYQAI